MKRFPEHRTDDRTIEQKALGLLFAMNSSEAENLLAILKGMAGSRTTAGGKRASMFVGE